VGWPGWLPSSSPRTGAGRYDTSAKNFLGRRVPHLSAERGEKHSWKEYAAWHLGLTVDANDETKARYAFVYGDLSRIHRSGLIACVYRASEWRHKKVEVTAHRLLQELDKAAGVE
jgi:hypothetical protein